MLAQKFGKSEVLVCILVLKGKRAFKLIDNRDKELVHIQKCQKKLYYLLINSKMKMKFKRQNLKSKS